MFLLKIRATKEQQLELVKGAGHDYSSRSLPTLRPGIDLLEDKLLAVLDEIVVESLGLGTILNSRGDGETLLSPGAALRPVENIEVTGSVFKAHGVYAQ